MSQKVCVHTPPIPPGVVCEHTAGPGVCACANTPEFPASDKRGDKPQTTEATTTAIVATCDDRARVDMTPAAKPPQVWTLSFRTEGDGPPPALRVRALLKRALRSFGLRCVDYRVDAPAATADAGRGLVEGATNDR
jgi:hypothetical protein